MSESNGFTTAAELFTAPPKRRFESVEVSGRRFRLQSLYASEAQKWLSDNDKKPRTINERLIAAVVVDGEGNLVFGHDDIAKLTALDAAFIAQLAKLCMKHIGIDSLEDLEAEVKN